MVDFRQLADSVLAGGDLSREQCLEVLSVSDEESLGLVEAVWRIRRHYHGRRVQVQVLSNAKSGLCSEDCHYCSQSCVSTAEIGRYPLKARDLLLTDAREARRLQARRFCMGLSGRTLSDTEVASLCEVIWAIKAEVGIAICCSLGFLTPEQARQLRAAGLDRVNHNLNTSERYYSSICTTHTFADRVRNLEICREAGLEVCSGGIVGQGETDADIVDLLLALRRIGPDSIPINFLIPVPGTPFQEQKTGLTPLRCLRILALARLLHPAADIRVAGGREVHLRSLQPMALFLVNSIFVNGYLTEEGQPQDEALRMVADLGFEIELEGAAGAYV
ncbi:MAG TPA: biotin synthase BioB [Candidatus Sumerlaeota bacterium]|nr:biotin synthase BioB [Candidatus Sumerlaeota bacterium]